MKRRVLSLLLALLLTLSLLPSMAWAASAVEIKTAEEFAAMDAAGNYKLMADISVTVPYGSLSNPFTGTFDGDGHTVTLKIDSSSSCQGLFAYNTGTITNVKTIGSIVGSSMTGGIVGKNEGTVEQCANDASVSGTQSVGGISGYSTNAIISSCYNSGMIKGSKRVGGITGQLESTKLTNCYNKGTITYTASSTVATGGIVGYANKGKNGATISNCYTVGTITDANPAATSQVGAFIGYTTDGLTLQNNYCLENSYSIEIGFNRDNKYTVSKKSAPELKNLAQALGSEWISDAKNINAGYPLLSWQVEKEPAIVPVSSVFLDGSPRSGKNLSAQAKGEEDATPTGIRYQWQVASSKDGDFSNISGATGQGFALTDNLIGTYIRVIVNGENGSSATSPAIGPVLVSEAAILAKDIEALGSLPTFMKTEDALTLPSLGAQGSTITWESSNEALITNQGIVKLPETKNETVTLTATLSFGGTTEKKSFSILLYSKQSIAEEGSDDSLYLNNAIASLQWYSLHPVFGRDSNINTILKEALSNRSYKDLSVRVTKAENPEDQSAFIGTSGDIHYYYSDPSCNETNNPMRIPLTFTLTKGSASAQYQVNAIVPWNRDLVNEYLTKNIFSALPIPTVADNNFDLPKYIGGKGGKTWVELSYTVSDETALGISSEKQKDSETFYEPYVGKIKALPVDKTVTLTVTAKFNRGTPILLTKTYPITIKADPAAIEARRQELQSKLNAGLSSAGLQDFVTKKPLDPLNVVNDIQFPTTRDFGVDGKYIPITIESDNTSVITPFSVNNAARVTVYRPLPSEKAQEVKLTIKMTEKASGISVSKVIPVTVQPLTQKELDDEIALMEEVRAHYFDGIKQDNSSADNITTNLHAFQEAYLNKGTLSWVYDSKNLVNHGIVPVAMDDWEKLEQWRTFRSSNPSVITHENLLVSRQKESKNVTITSYLSSEVYGKYAVKHPSNAVFQKLYYQPVSASLIVRGSAPTSSKPLEEKLSVSFTLQGSNETLIAKTSASNFAEGSTVFDVFTKVLRENGYHYSARGSYVYAITTPDGKTLEELGAGAKSGWMYKVNGVIPSAYMAASTLKSGDNIVVFFTKDYTEETGYSSGNWKSAVPPKINKTEIQAIKNDDGSYSVSLPEEKQDVRPSKSGRVVSIPNVQKGQVIVIVHADGTETVVKKSLIENDTAYFLLKKNERIKIIEYKKAFHDVAPEDWHSDAVQYVVSHQLFEGTSGETFAPSDTMTRGMLASVLYRLEDKPSSQAKNFTDITSEIWCADAVSWAASSGITNGYGDGSFAPNEDISREQLFAMLYRYAKATGLDTAVKSDLTAYQDANEVDDYAKDAILWAVGCGLMKGRGNACLSPNEPVTRAETSVILQRLVSLMIKSE